MNDLAGNGESFLFIIDYSLSTGIIIPLADCESQNVFYSVDGISNHPDTKPGNKITIEKNPVSFPEYQAAFNYVQNEIHKGNSYLVNLTFPTPVELNAGLTEIFLASSARYKLIYQEKFLVFSPEPFVKIRDGRISTYPMKGTIDASLQNARELILNNEKETAEHATIVDLLRNDLSRVASNVSVEKFRYFEEISTSGKNLLQMSSVISGDLYAGYRNNLGDIIITLLPAGSICGAPKTETLKIIAEAENYERGFYSGIFGIFDGENLNSGVMIRFIENQDGQMVYKSGGGITAKSDPRDEYQELIDKIYVPIN